MGEPTNEPEQPQTFEGEAPVPYTIEVAARVRGLPPYLFGKINELKYRKRRAGVDVIDLGMGNPTDPPEPWIIDKLCEAARDPRNHRYSVAQGVYNLRREAAQRYESRFGVSLDPDHEVVTALTLTALGVLVGQRRLPRRLRLHRALRGQRRAVVGEPRPEHLVEDRQVLRARAQRRPAGPVRPLLVAEAGLRTVSVHGVRIFADLVPGVLVDTEPGALDALLRLELAAAEDPGFHAVATQLHVLAERD